MTQRMTISHIEAKVDTVNRLLGFDPAEVKWNTVGAVCLERAYGATGVRQTSNESGGERDLMGGLGTMRECAHFLNGMIQALRIRDEF